MRHFLEHFTPPIYITHTTSGICQVLVPISVTVNNNVQTSGFHENAINQWQRDGNIVQNQLFT